MLMDIFQKMMYKSLLNSLHVKKEAFYWMLDKVQSQNGRTADFTAGYFAMSIDMM
jgi:hypothetical protein